MDVQGDEVRATAIRRVVTESSTGSTDSRRVRTQLTVRVKKVVYSAAADSDQGATEQASLTARPTSGAAATLHVAGPVSSESDFVKLGAYHTLDLEAGRDFTLTKAEDGWDSIGIDRVKEATESGNAAEVGAIVCGEGMLHERLAS